MNSASMEMSGSAQSRASTPQKDLDEALAVLTDQAPGFAKLGPLERAELLRECLPRLHAVSRAWVEAACKAKGLDPSSPAASEEWLGGPLVTLRNLRLLIQGLTDIHSRGKPELPAGAIRTGWDGRTEVNVAPGDNFDKALLTGFSCTVRMEKGMSEREVRERQASYYSRKDNPPGVSLILGAGNVASIPPTDAFHKMFTEGKVCIVKLNPVNEYLGPFYEQALKPLIDRGYLRFCYGGADVGTYLSYNDRVTDIHITGSDRTHDLIVWGPPGPERERRKAENDPLLKKNMTSELGCVTPVIVVPGDYSPAELRFIAENVATQVVNNASFNCNAAKVLVTSEGWPQREAFVQHVRDVLAAAPTRLAYYPGAEDRYASLTKEHKDIVRIGRAEPRKLPWTMIRGLDAKSSDPLFSTEPFCGILSEVALAERDAASFLRAAGKFANDKLWGTLSCSLIIHPRTEENPDVKHTLDVVLDSLRYGIVAINHWPGIAYGTITAPWGGHPSATLKDVQSGLGFVHNSPMLEGIEKGILRGPLTVMPKPPWFITHKRADKVAQRMVDFEAEPSWLKIPGIAMQALLG